MNKEDILKASRQENKNRDLAELEASRLAGSIAASVGATVCAVISILASQIARMMLYSPWVIYFSIMGTNWLVRAIKLKKKSDLIMAIMFLSLAVYAMIRLIVTLMGAAP